MAMNQPIDKQQQENWLIKKIVPKIAENLGTTWSDVGLDISIPENSFFLSTVYFVDIKFKKENKSIHAVIKKPSDNELVVKYLHTHAQFHNEILFYKKIATESKRYPRCFYAFESKDDLKDTLICTENIGTMGFEICPTSYDIPFEYVIAGVQEIGRFHAMGYIMKARDPVKFFKIVGEIQESRYVYDDWQPQFINFIAKRPIEWLRKEKYDSKFCDKMEHFLENTFDNIMMDAIEVKEPLAVFCHGDFTRNNILFRKTQDSLEGKLIDFAMLRYASPSIDLSTFLYLSVSNIDRKHRFNEIIDAYYEAMTKYFTEDNMEVPDCYSYDSFIADYKRHALLGYAIALFFLPVLHGHVNFANLGPTDSFNIDVMGPMNKAAGGESMSRNFADMLLEIRNFGGLDHIQGLEKV